MRRATPRNPQLSLVVVIYDMEREAPRTLYSLSTKYQLHIQNADYEVVVVDNGSPRRLPESLIHSLGENFRYIYLPRASASPAHALNLGVSASRGTFVGIMIDGARILTPGLLRYALLAASSFEQPLVATINYHLGFERQPVALTRGYGPEVEDRLLASIDWPADGYRLFEIGAFGGSGLDGWFKPISESSCFLVRRALYEEMGGYDERFDGAGGGLVNSDMYRRLCEREETNLILLLGEGTFHQCHGGAITSNSGSSAFNDALAAAYREYHEITGRRWEKPVKECRYFGHVPAAAIPFLRLSAAALEGDTGSPIDVGRIASD